VAATNTEARSLPIPIDTFVLPQVQLTPPDEATERPDDLRFWVLGILGASGGACPDRRLTAMEGLSGFQINLPTFRSYGVLVRYIDDVLAVRRGQSICVDLSGPKIRVRGFTEISGQSFINLLADDPLAVVDSPTTPS
jgi:hypothetical protein